MWRERERGERVGLCVWERERRERVTVCEEREGGLSVCEERERRERGTVCV